MQIAGIYSVEQYTVSTDLLSMLTELAYKEFDLLGGGPLARFAIVQENAPPSHSSPRVVLLMSVSHAICDAHSLAVMHAELTTLYTSLAENPTVHYNTVLLPRIELEFVEIVEKQQTKLLQLIPQQLPFWRRELSGDIPDLLSDYRFTFLLQRPVAKTS